jgi:hypothetical protein
MPKDRPQNRESFRMNASPAGDLDRPILARGSLSPILNIQPSAQQDGNAERLSTRWLASSTANQPNKARAQTYRGPASDPQRPFRCSLGRFQHADAQVRRNRPEQALNDEYEPEPDDQIVH